MFLAVVAGACSGETSERDEPVVLELEGQTVQLAPGERVVEIGVTRAAAGREFEPASAEARSDDVVRFTTRDGHSHVIAFEETSLAPDAAAFLEQTDQLRGPPLLNDGASWVVSLDGAPPGEYPFVCLTHDQRGVLTVSPR